MVLRAGQPLYATLVQAGRPAPSVRMRCFLQQDSKEALAFVRFARRSQLYCTPRSARTHSFVPKRSAVKRREAVKVGQPNLRPGSLDTMAAAALAAAKLKRRSNADMNRLRQPPPPPVSGDATIRLKLLTIGAAHAGKSCIVKRYCEGRFVSKYVQTVGVDYGVKPVDVDGTMVRVNFWDLSGHAAFLEVRNEFYKDTSATLLVYDASDRNSFEELETWLREAHTYGMRENTPVCVCANKIDRPRKVSESEGRKWARERGYDYFETSAQSGANVSEVFECAFRKALRR